MLRISWTISVGHLVVLGDLRLERAQPFGDEAADGVDQRVEGFGIEGHAFSPVVMPDVFRHPSVLQAWRRRRRWTPEQVRGDGW